MRLEDDSIGIGSGSLLCHRNRIYILTARHNLTGRNAFTGRAISKRQQGGAFPTEVRFHLPYETKLDGDQVGFDAQPCVLKLYSSGEPIWMVHSADDLRHDVAVISLSDVVAKKLIRSGVEDDTDADFLAETEGLAASSDFVTLGSGKSLRLAALTHYVIDGFKLRVGHELFVLGFPEGISASDLPIWKRATIASEPNATVDGLPILLVDTATRRGMSGGPAIARAN